MDAPFVGRSREVAQLRAAVVSAANGAGRMILLSGPAGIGKSRLTKALVEIAAEYRVPVARGYAVDDAGMPACWPWTRLARDVGTIAPYLSEDLSGSNAPLSEATRFQSFTAIADALRDAAAATGLVVVLEDLHWADRTSLLLLRHIATDVHATRLLIVATFRDPADGTFADVLPELLRAQDAQSIRLSGLTAADIAHWLRQVQPRTTGAVATSLRDYTDGNPLFVRLLVDSMSDDEFVVDPAANPEVRRLAVAQLARLDRQTRDVLDAASVTGERIDPLLLSSILSRSEDEVARDLDTAAGAGVVESGDGQFTFAHALIRDAVYAELAPSTRMLLHRKAALALSQGPVADSTAGPVAAHWQRASGEDSAAQCMQWARRAAESAMSTVAYAEAIRFLDLAIEAAGTGAPPALLAELNLQLAIAEFAGGRIGASIEQCVRAADYAEQADRPDLIGAAALVVHGVSSKPILETVERLCVAALRTLPADATTLRSRLFAQRSLAASEDENPSAAMELSATALELADHSGDPDAILDGLHARHVALSAPQFVEQRRELCARAIEIDWTARQPLAALWGHVWNIDAGLQLGDLGLVDRSLAMIEQVATTRKLPLAWWHLHRCRATRAALVGDYVAAQNHTESARKSAEAMGDSSLVGLYHAFQTQIVIIRGVVTDFDSQMAMLQAAPQIGLVRIFVPINLALAGDIDGARAAFEEFRTVPDTLEVGPRWAAMLFHIAIAADLLADAEVAEKVFTKVRDLHCYYSCDGGGALFCSGSMARVIGDMARTCGRLDDAVDEYRRAIDMDARIGARPYLALSRLGLARTLVQRGRAADNAEVRELLDLAAREFRRLDLPGPLQRADALKAQVAHAAKAANPLSDRESQVAQLIAAAMSNREIATKLVLSERTVETHVRSILAKLGYSNRTEIAAWSLRGQTSNPADMV
ncbi:AAA family ATPase [Antrihabitans sp. YC3-6]|uniref:AAA family ATPase n=1 Tax=Antrihabitans stalagmiti TaxID=2799499 RepID=A0A934NUQ0_9NOCA|nr:LuxR family transcriptional regulator [Antrihabitans stalagmiti]MBJ8341629.1 AAA family ATPase [Antrihabitans stalagmiti]